MKPEITDVIADLVFQTNPELASRLEYQAEALREVECINPVIGRWIDANDVKYLLSTFDLKDGDFAARFPSIANVTQQDRQRVVAAIERHFDQCQHCSLKRGYDLELDAQIKLACQQNNSLLLQLLEEDGETLSEEDERGRAKLERAAAANHNI
jgi:hypothetical protein